MEVGNTILITFLIYYTFKFFNMFLDGAQNIKITNNKLDELRKIKVKTIEEQKEFLNLIKPEKKKRKWVVDDYLSLFLMIIIGIGIFNIYNFILNYFNIVVSLAFVILFVIVFPLLVTMLLSKFNINDNNTLYNMFKKVK